MNAARHGAGLLLVLAVSVTARAADPASEEKTLSSAILQAERDVRAAAGALNAWRDETAARRMPLARRLEALQHEVGERRTETERRRQARLQGLNEHEALAARVKHLADECEFIQTLVGEYRRSLETRAGRAESEWLTPRLAGIDRALAPAEGFTRLPQAVPPLLGLAELWSRERFGGASFAGHALDQAGVRHAGRFAVFGPLAYFASDDRATAGLTVSRVGSTAPSVFAGFKDDGAPAAVAALVSGASAVVPVDVTRGDAMRVAATRETLTDHIRKGGFVMVPLLAVGAAALALVIVKTLSLARVRLHRAAAVSAVIEAIAAGHGDEARQAAARVAAPLGPILREGVEHADAPPEHLEEMLTERVAGAVPGLERHLQTLAVLGAVAPLLGLLGTVTGMIHTFDLVTMFGSGDAKLLSGGISEALVTTEFGLIIAVPVLLVHAFLARRVRVIIGVMERAVADFVHGTRAVHAGDAPRGEGA